ncbi:MAG: hypothetical protein WC548_02010 [Candidatus Pacearchaeota archaeon]
MTKHKKYWILSVAGLLVVLILIVNSFSGNFKFNFDQKMSNLSIEKLENEYLEIENCQSEIELYLNNEQNETIEDCRMKINNLMGKVGRLYVEEKSETIRKKCEIMLVKLHIISLTIDSIQNKKNILYDNLTNEEIERKELENKEIISQIEDLKNKI